jgi:hypothetical protein
MTTPDSTQEEEGGSVSSWCGWHTDHGSLTGLSHLFSKYIAVTFAMVLSQNQ